MTAPASPERTARRTARGGNQGNQSARDSTALRARSRQSCARLRAAIRLHDQAKPGDTPGWGRAWRRRGSCAISLVKEGDHLILRFAVFELRTKNPGVQAFITLRGEVSNHLIDKCVDHFASPFRRAGMAGMGGTIRHVVPTVKPRIVKKCYRISA